MSVNDCSPRSRPTTMQSYLSLMPLSAMLFPARVLCGPTVSCRSTISRFSMSGSAGTSSVVMLSFSFCSCVSSPMTCMLSPGNSMVSPFGMFILWLPRSMLLTCTPKRERSARSRSVRPHHVESTGTVNSPMCMSLSSRRPSKSGRRVPSTCAAISRDCRKSLSRCMLLFFSRLDMAMITTTASARVIMTAFEKRVR